MAIGTALTAVVEKVRGRASLKELARELLSRRAATGRAGRGSSKK
jgi:hypothetical protein